MSPIGSKVANGSSLHMGYWISCLRFCVLCPRTVSRACFSWRGRYSPAGPIPAPKHGPFRLQENRSLLFVFVILFAEYVLYVIMFIFTMAGIASHEWSEHDAPHTDKKRVSTTWKLPWVSTQMLMSGTLNLSRR